MNKNAIFGEIEIESDRHKIKRPFNTITQGFARFMGALMTNGMPSFGQIYVNNVAQTTGAWGYNLQMQYYSLGEQHDKAKFFGIYFDYDNLSLGYNHNMLFDDKMRFTSSTINDPQRYDFDNFSNSLITREWDLKNKRLIISKSFKNISTETKYIRRMYLLVPSIFTQGTTNVYPGADTAQNKQLILACEEVSFEVLPEQQLSLRFIFKFEGLIDNTINCLRLFSNAYLATSPTHSATYNQTDGTTRNITFEPFRVFNVVAGTAGSFMRVGYSSAPVEANAHSMVNIATNTTYASFRLDFLPYNEDEQCYDVKTSVLVTNTHSVSQNYSEIGVYRHGMYVSLTMPPFLSHRQVLDEPVTLEPGQSAEFSLTFKCFCIHKPTAKLNITADPVEAPSLITPSGNFPKSSDITLYAQANAGFVFHKWIITTGENTAEIENIDDYVFAVGEEDEYNITAKFNVI